jgi:hypothetical protein
MGVDDMTGIQQQRWLTGRVAPALVREFPGRINPHCPF